MKNTDSWHDDDSFWELFAPFMFPEERVSSTPAEVDQILSLMNLDEGAAILDMGCGPGRHSLELARRGFQVTGVDRTAYFLKRARENAEFEELSVEFVQSDMRAFERPASFNVALSLYTTFGYFAEPAENQAVLSNIYKSLEQAGRLIVDVTGKEVLARIFREKNWQELDNTFFIEQRRVSKNWSWIENRWILINDQQRIDYNVSHWVYSASELVSMLSECGFETVDIFGGLDGSPYDQNATRLVAVAGKS